MAVPASLSGAFSHLVFFDTETTGLNFRTDEIIELGAVALDAQGAECDAMDDLIRLSPGRALPPFITKLTGITPEQLAHEGREKSETAARFAQMLAQPGTLLIAYNAQFDLNFLYWFLRAHGHAEVLRNLKFLDAMTVYRDRRDYPHKLENAIEAYGLQEVAVNSHRAVDDARAIPLLLEAMEAEKSDLDRYVNLFGYNPKYGVSGQRVSSVRYLAQPYDRTVPLYDRV
jgi:DNA polymerase-3 subunit epsilon